MSLSKEYEQLIMERIEEALEGYVPDGLIVCAADAVLDELYEYLKEDM